MSTAVADILDPRIDDVIAVRPLQPTIGAEIEGVDLSRSITPAQRDAIRARCSNTRWSSSAISISTTINMRPSPRSSGRSTCTRAHGATRRSRRSTRSRRPMPQRIHRDVGTGDAYHSDTSWRLVPTWGAVLRAVTLPDVGGDTIWVDGHLAYQGLSDDDAPEMRVGGNGGRLGGRDQRLDRGGQAGVRNLPEPAGIEHTVQRKTCLRMSARLATIAAEPASPTICSSIIMTSRSWDRGRSPCGWVPGGCA